MSTTNNTQKLEVRNRKSFAALLQENPHADFEIIYNDNQKPFFAVGDTIGYVSPKAEEFLNANGDDKAKAIAGLQYCETKKPGMPDVDPVTQASNWVPTLMVVGNKRKARWSFSASDLQS